MKKNKFILLLVVIIIIINPNLVKALTEEEAYAKLDSLPFKQIDGKKYFETNIVDPDIILEDECIYTEEDYNNRYDKEDNKTKEEWILHQTNMCKSYLYSDMLSLYLKHVDKNSTNLDEVNFSFNEEDFDKNKAIVTYYYENENGSNYVEMEVGISYLNDVDTKEVTKAKNILKNFKEGSKLSGLQLVNLMYHYGKMEEADYKKDAIFARYPSFKKIMEKNPEYEYVSNGGRGGGTSIMTHRVIQAGIFKDGIMYGIKQLDHYEEQILFVDKTLPGSLKEKAIETLNKYFNNKVKIDVSIDDKIPDDITPEGFSNYINSLLKTKDLSFEGYDSTISINESELKFVIVEVPNQYLDKGYVESFDNKTGVNIKTNSYDVPVDVRVEAKDVKDDKNIIDKFDEEIFNIDAAYDMSLIKSFDKTFIKQIDKGIEVYFPVNENYKVGDKYKVYYVSDTKEEKEIYEAEIVEVDKKIYAKFITNHFSTYVLTSEKIINPDTADPILNNIIITTISFISLCTTIYFLNKNQEI